MNTAIVLCRNLTKVCHGTRWFTPRNLQFRVLRRSASQFTQSYAITHQIEERKIQQEKVEHLFSSIQSFSEGDSVVR